MAAHGWNQMFVKWLLDYGFVNVDNDGVTFVKNVNKDNGTKIQDSHEYSRG